MAKNWNISPTGTGARVTHSATLFDNQTHRLNETASLTKNFNSPGLTPDQIGGRLDYQHKPSNISTFASVDHYKGLGNDVNAGARISTSLIDNNTHRLDASIAATKNITPHGLVHTQAGLDYLHKPSGAEFGVSGHTTQHGGSGGSIFYRQKF